MNLTLGKKVALWPVLAALVLLILSPVPGTSGGGIVWNMSAVDNAGYRYYAGTFIGPLTSAVSQCGQLISIALLPLPPSNAIPDGYVMVDQVVKQGTTKNVCK